jgi:hypothetical protein
MCAAAKLTLKALTRRRTISHGGVSFRPHVVGSNALIPGPARTTSASPRAEPCVLSTTANAPRLMQKLMCNN